MTKCAADYLVRTVPGLSDKDSALLGKRQYAGHISVDPVNDGIGKDQNNKTVIWLNGGPGCSSMDGLFIEFGPFRPVDGGEQLQLKESHQYQPYNLLFIDQPFKTGFSYTSRKGQTHQGHRLFRGFHKGIFKDISAIHWNTAGESFAGIYIPYYGRAILDQVSSKKLDINLSGLAIGNGWIDPTIQYPSNVKYAEKFGILEKSVLENVQNQMVSCKRALDFSNGTAIKIQICENVVEYVLQNSIKARQSGVCLNMYDIRYTDKACGMSWPPDLNAMVKYLQKDEVAAAVNAQNKGKKWEECASDAFEILDIGGDAPSVNLLPGLLQKMPVILFNGEYDFICNYMGLFDMVLNLTWNGQKGLENYDIPIDFNVLGTKSGFRYDSRNLSFIVISNSSHMVGVENPIGVSMILAELTKTEDFIKTNSPNNPKNSSITVALLASLVIASFILSSIYVINRFRISRRYRQIVEQSPTRGQDLELQALSPSPEPALSTN